MALKVGDKVKLLPTTTWGNSKSNPQWGGQYGFVEGITTSVSDSEWCVNWDNGESNGGYKEGRDIELIKSSKIMSSLKEKFALVFKNEPEKSFIKAGIIDANEVLTDDGARVFMSWLLKKDGAAFKKVVASAIFGCDKNKEECKDTSTVQTTNSINHW